MALAHLLLLSMIVFSPLAAPHEHQKSAPAAAAAAAVAAAAASASGFRSLLKRVDRHLPRKLQFQRAIQRSHLRAKLLSTRFNCDNDTAKISLTEVGGAFSLEIYMGSTLQPLQVTLDTANDLFWVQCANNVEPADYLFDYHDSATFLPLSCNNTLCCQIDHQCDEANACVYQAGRLASDIVTLASTEGYLQQFRDIGFGCATEYNGVTGGLDGIMGFGRRGISFYSQISARIGSKFSYCLQANTDTSPLFFGDAAAIQQVPGTVSTPILDNYRNPSLYFVELKAVAVGTTVEILCTEANGATVIDSGTALTYLPETVYADVRAAFVTRITLPLIDGIDLGLDLCYDASNNRDYCFPSLYLKLWNALLIPPVGNYFFPPDPDEHAGVYCLAILSSDGLGLSVIGNLMQQNYQVLYDTAANTISFSPAQCDQL